MRGVFGLDARRPALEELGQLLLGHEVDQLSGQLAMPVGEVIPRGGGQLVDVLRPAPSVTVRLGNSRQPGSLQRIEVSKCPLLRDVEMGGDLA